MLVIGGVGPPRDGMGPGEVRVGTTPLIGGPERTHQTGTIEGGDEPMIQRLIGQLIPHAVRGLHHSRQFVPFVHVLPVQQSSTPALLALQRLTELLDLSAGVPMGLAVVEHPFAQPFDRHHAGRTHLLDRQVDQATIGLRHQRTRVAPVEGLAVVGDGLRLPPPGDDELTGDFRRGEAHTGTQHVVELPGDPGQEVRHREPLRPLCTVVGRVADVDEDGAGGDLAAEPGSLTVGRIRVERVVVADGVGVPADQFLGQDERAGHRYGVGVQGRGMRRWTVFVALLV